ncbi:docking protein 2-like [Thalassophryne amazonica]|uniref:docking protein 2-like n=1 Tax=Thalassophryne amazonica TaxID=390379 RepID=UPI001471670C|nr:docking protein 2-like [Thalassophryne amazonica]
MDGVYKEGMLYLQEVKLIRKTWQKIWMVLFKPSSCAAGRLEIYSMQNDTGSNSIFDQRKAAQQKPPAKKVVRFCEFLGVSHAPLQSCPAGCAAFYLNTTLRTYTLASPLCQDWLRALALLAFQKDPGDLHKGVFHRGSCLTMEDNDLYSPLKTDLSLPQNQYQVTVQSTEASQRCKLADNYLIALETQAMLLLDVTNGHIVHRWPYKFLRKFGEVEGGFSIEAGRRCDSGDGVFIFFSPHAPEIVCTISSRCSAEATSKDSSVQPLCFHKESSPVHYFPTAAPTHDHVLSDKDDKSVCIYSTISDSSVPDARRSSLKLPFTCGKEAEEEEEDLDYIEWGQFPEAINQDDAEADSAYCNLRGSTQSRSTPNQSETDSCEYTDVKIPDVVPELESVSDIYTLPKPRCERQPLEKNHSQPGSTETPGSFKHRLAEIISKDLARIQSLPFSGVGNSN